MTDVTRSWFAGVDWGSEKHQVCMRDVAGTVVGERAFAHNGAGLVAMCDWLVSVAGRPSTVAVAIEVPHGPVVDVLLDRGFAVHAIKALVRKSADGRGAAAIAAFQAIRCDTDMPSRVI